MDLQKIAGTLLSSETISSLSDRSGASDSQVKKVLSSALPALLSGADKQANDSETSEGFAAALASHAKNSTLDLSSFLDGIDMEDGAKIIGHLLGKEEDSVTKTVAKDTGVSANKVGSILSGAAPLLMSLLGQQADEDDDKDSGIGSLMGTLLSNVDVGSILTGLLTDSDSEKKTTTKKKSAKEETDVGSIVGSLLGKLLK